MAKKGDYVTIHNIVLRADERAPQVPDDTKQVPLEMWVRGWLLNDASLDDQVTVETVTGRHVEGRLVDVYPTYSHSFGKHIPEIYQIGKQLRSILFGGDAS